MSASTASSSRDSPLFNSRVADSLTRDPTPNNRCAYPLAIRLMIGISPSIKKLLIPAFPNPSVQNCRCSSRVTFSPISRVSFATSNFALSTSPCTLAARCWNAVHSSTMWAACSLAALSSCRALRSASSARRARSFAEVYAVESGRDGSVSVRISPRNPSNSLVRSSTTASCFFRSSTASRLRSLAMFGAITCMHVAQRWPASASHLATRRFTEAISVSASTIAHSAALHRASNARRLRSTSRAARSCVRSAS